MPPVSLPLTGTGYPVAPVDPWSTIEGSPHPLGAWWVPEQQAWNFALHARHATAVTLLLYGRSDLSTPLAERRLDPLNNRSSRVWHLRLPSGDVPGAAYYAYRIDGPSDRKAGHRFDPAKVLLDPYARAVFFP